jgi:NAD(P)-dependent dehydrogenase (short-subunit alcohol dehydrogenase family)
MRIDPGTRALVSGASRGIGRALCAELAARGTTVGLVARSGDELEALAASLPGTHHPLPCDVGDAAAIQAAVARFIERAGAWSSSSPTPASRTTARSSTSPSTPCSG